MNMMKKSLNHILSIWSRDFDDLMEAKKGSSKSENLEMIEDLFSSITDDYRTYIREKRKNEFEIQIKLDPTFNVNNISSSEGIDSFIRNTRKLSDLYTLIKEAMDRLGSDCVYQIEMESEYGDRNHWESIIINLNYGVNTQEMIFKIRDILIINKEELKNTISDKVGVEVVSIRKSEEEYDDDCVYIDVDFGTQVTSFDENGEFIYLVDNNKFESVFAKYKKYLTEFDYSSSETGIIVYFKADKLILR